MNKVRENMKVTAAKLEEMSGKAKADVTAAGFKAGHPFDKEGKQAADEVRTQRKAEAAEARQEKVGAANTATAGTQGETGKTETSGNKGVATQPHPQPGPSGGGGGDKHPHLAATGVGAAGGHGYHHGTNAHGANHGLGNVLPGQYVDRQGQGVPGQHGGGQGRPAPGQYADGHGSAIPGQYGGGQGRPAPGQYADGQGPAIPGQYGGREEHRAPGQYVGGQGDTIPGQYGGGQGLAAPGQHEGGQGYAMPAAEGQYRQPVQGHGAVPEMAGYGGFGTKDAHEADTLKTPGAGYAATDPHDLVKTAPNAYEPTSTSVTSFAG